MTEPYPDTYKEACFQAWYSAGCPEGFSHIVKVLPDYEGRKPTRLLLNKWVEQEWALRADELNTKAIELADNRLVLEKVEMLKQQAERGKELQEKGMEYIKTTGFDTASAAVQAVIRGANLERESRGIGELIYKMAKMSDDELKKEIMNRLETLSNDVVEGDVKEEENEPED